uniref:Uncharacterized protein n=1 Tax=Timema poppense TaxID=170557 RepID=A0A7R9D3W8_TIMPO|nr:unnamed protein product [Timema poppensis]
MRIQLDEHFYSQTLLTPSRAASSLLGIRQLGGRGVLGVDLVGEWGSLLTGGNVAGIRNLDYISQQWTCGLRRHTSSGRFVDARELSTYPSLPEFKLCSVRAITLTPLLSLVFTPYCPQSASFTVPVLHSVLSLVCLLYCTWYLSLVFPLHCPQSASSIVPGLNSEELNRGKPNWEHLNDELHVLITVEDTENRANLKMERAVEEVKKLLIPADGEDELKKRQLMELAIINGTYRDSNAKAAAAAGTLWLAQSQDFCLIGTSCSAKVKLFSTLSALLEMLCTGEPIKSQNHPSQTSAHALYSQKLADSFVGSCDEEWRRLTAAAAAETQRLLSPGMPGMGTPMRSPATPLGAPLILSPRLPVPTSAASLLNGSGHQGPLLSPHDPHGLIYTPYADYANYAALAASPLLQDYATADHSGAAAKQRRHYGQLREHPYQRAGALS